MKEIRTVELFAGVGGFRLALDAASGEKQKFRTVWANQWEPSTTRQHAAEIYKTRFGSEGFSNKNIEHIVEHDFESIPDHDLLVGGFPCQDYSVARTLNQSHGLLGKKGVLFWSIYAILKGKGEKAPSYIFLENVDRLLKSPAKQRGKDFAIMLAALSDLGYAVEWRVVNAADYGFPQRRRRVFILGYKKGTKLYKQIDAEKNKNEWLTKRGVIADAFPVSEETSLSASFEINGTYADLSEHFSSSAPKLSPFEISGVMVNRKVFTTKVVPVYDGPRTVLKDILVNHTAVPEEFFISDDKLKNWEYQKGAKNELRKTSSGHEYHYSEGAMTFPDSLDKPSRTIVTGEGGSGSSRFKHVIRTKDGRHRRLTPLELERLNMFPDNHTKLEGVSDGKRAFIMGNALVVGAIEKVGKSLSTKL